MKNYIDYKVTIWERLHFDDDTNMSIIIEKFEKGYLPAEICEEKGFRECESLFDTEEFITPSENDGQSTIEVYHKDELIWDNSFESEVKRKK